MWREKISSLDWLQSVDLARDNEHAEAEMMSEIAP